MTPVERADRRLLAVLSDAMDEAARRAGPHLVCRPGCTGCCHGPFPIHRLDAWRLARGLTELAARDPARAAAVTARARAATAILGDSFPGDPATGFLHQDEDAQEAFFTHHADVPCPALDPATGRCDVYEHRPTTCRTFGPPLRIGESDLAPCDLCFREATEDEMERCRVEPDPHGLEDRLVGRFGEDRETLIAFVLRGRSDPERPGLRTLKKDRS